MPGNGGRTNQYLHARGTGIKGGEKLGVEPVLKAVDIADPNVEHLGVMAYAAYFQWVKPRMKPCERLRVIPEGKTCRVNKPVSDLPKSC